LNCGIDLELANISAVTLTSVVVAVEMATTKMTKKRELAYLKEWIFE
jgi:hypothetical protein